MLKLEFNVFTIREGGESAERLPRRLIENIDLKKGKRRLKQKKAKANIIAGKPRAKASSKSSLKIYFHSILTTLLRIFIQLPMLPQRNNHKFARKT